MSSPGFKGKKNDFILQFLRTVQCLLLNWSYLAKVARLSTVKVTYLKT